MLKILCLFSKFQILLKVPMLLELKGGDKTESRILVFTVYRLFVVTSKVPARIDHHFHYLGKMSVSKMFVAANSMPKFWDTIKALYTY